ncbi:hypothetical protein HanXRQr2_Chr06g0260911 [Helianthus annuus]|uniref:Uncharacterized protein n=1 Tax=Helianthus annuus TaxID=4232 RepID=A0A251U3Y3_HELAN|nr:hypothetical protein HanXRQr2_Chr06g0260911 [Helianthus annuus]KAJ0915609.1 hypothetical protein HanPSC8_Chr06g0251771 [Helianthus annuus]
MWEGDNREQGVCMVFLLFWGFFSCKREKGKREREECAVWPEGHHHHHSGVVFWGFYF